MVTTGQTVWKKERPWTEDAESKARGRELTSQHDNSTLCNNGLEITKQPFLTYSGSRSFSCFNNRALCVQIRYFSDQGQN